MTEAAALHGRVPAEATDPDKVGVPFVRCSRARTLRVAIIHRRVNDRPAPLSGDREPAL